MDLPRYDAPSKEAAVGAYYDAYYDAVTELQKAFPDRVLVCESPALFDDVGAQRRLFAFLGLPGAAPVAGVRKNEQSYGA